MERSVLIIIGIVVVAGLLVALLGHRPPPTPTQTIAMQADALESACASACAGQRAQLTLSLPQGARLYTTEEAACISYGRALFCSRCACAMVQGITLEAGDHGCAMLPGEALTLDCTTFINS